MLESSWRPCEGYLVKEFYSISEGNATPLIRGIERDQLGTTLGALSSGILHVQMVGEQDPFFGPFVDRLSLYDLDSGESEVLLELPLNHSFDGLLHPGGNMVVYSDVCLTQECWSGDDVSDNVFYVFDLETRGAREIYRDVGGGGNFYLAPGAWADSQTVALVLSAFAGEGERRYPSLRLLGLQNGQTRDLSLHPDARAFSFIEGGTRIAFTTFSWERESLQSQSTVIVESVETGVQEAVLTRSDVRYESIQWIDENRLLVGARDIESIEECAYDPCVHGPRDVRVIDIEQGTETELSAYPRSLLLVQDGVLIYMDWESEPSVLLLGALDIDSGFDRILLRLPHRNSISIVR